MGQTLVQTTTPAPDVPRELGLWDVVFFNVSAVAGVRGLVFMARAGSGIVTLCLLGALTFFLPSAFAVIRLTGRYPQEGGMYVWVRETLGPSHAFLCAWFYFVGNVLFYPALLLSGVSIAAYVAGDGSRFLNDSTKVLAITVAVLWITALLNVTGFKVAKWVTNLGALCTIAVLALVSVVAALIGVRHGSATHFTVLPELSMSTIKYWASIALAFTGLELAPIAAGEIINPRVDVPRAAWISAGICTVFFVSGTVALLVVAPVNQTRPGHWNSPRRVYGLAAPRDELGFSAAGAAHFRIHGRSVGILLGWQLALAVRHRAEPSLSRGIIQVAPALAHALRVDLAAGVRIHSVSSDGRNR